MPKILRISLKPDLVYALAPILFSSIIGFVYSKVINCFFIYEVSAFWPEELVALKISSYSIISLFAKLFAKLSYVLPDMLIVISNSAREYITKNYNPKVQVYSLPIGVDPDRYPTRNKESSRRELIKRGILPAIVEKNFIVLYAGVITKITNVENLINAAYILRNNKDITFLIIGEGEEKENLEKFRSDKRMNNLYLLPFQEGSLVPYIISAADVCVVPLSSEPIYQTTVPTKFFDYLACHKPLLGICGGELEELINSNNIGFAVKDGEIDKLADTILNLQNSPSLIQTFEKNTHAALKLFSLDTLALTLDYVLKKEISHQKQIKFKN